MTRQGRQRGQSLAELALVLPLLLALFVGIADLGRAFYTIITLENAAREAVRYRAAFPDNKGIAEARAIAEAANAGISPVTVYWNPDQSTAGQPVGVMVEYDLQMITGSFLGFGSVTLTGPAEMMVLAGGS